jgi:hypothetical protein
MIHLSGDTIDWFGAEGSLSIDAIPSKYGVRNITDLPYEINVLSMRTGHWRKFYRQYTGSSAISNSYAFARDGVVICFSIRARNNHAAWVKQKNGESNEDAA